MEEDKEIAEKEQEKIVNEFHEITKKIRKSNIDLQQLNETVAKLRNMEGRLKSTMAALRDKLEVENTNSIEVYVSGSSHIPLFSKFLFHVSRDLKRFLEIFVKSEIFLK